MSTQFKDSVQETVHKGKLPVAQLAERIGKSPSYVYNCANPNLEDDFHLQGREIIPLTLASENYAVVNYICKGVGGVFLRVPQVEGIDLSLSENILETIEHLAELRRKYKEAMKDGVLSRSERRELEALKYEIVTHVMSLLEDMTKGGA